MPLKFPISYVIINVGKEARVSMLAQKTNPHELQLAGVLVYIVLDGKTKPSGSSPLFLTIEPFAYVVGNYTCQDGKDKRG